jgi:hypothetical protein
MKVIAGRAHAAPPCTLRAYSGDIAFLYWQLHQVNILRKYITQCAGIAQHMRRGRKSTTLHTHSLTRTRKRSMLMPPLERERGFLALSFKSGAAQHNVYFSGEKGGAGGKLPHAKILFDYFSGGSRALLANGIH